MPKTTRGKVASSKQWFTSGGVATLVGVTSQTIKNYIKRGKLEAVTLPTGYAKIPRAEVVRFLRELGRPVPALKDVPAKSIARNAKPRTPMRARKTPKRNSLHEAVTEFEKQYLSRLLEKTKGNVTHAIKISCLHRSGFYDRLRKHKLDPESFRSD